MRRMRRRAGANKKDGPVMTGQMIRVRRPMGDNKNFVLFIAISIAILLGYNYFFIAPQQAAYEEQLAQQQAIEEALAPTETPESAPLQEDVTPTTQAMPEAGRVEIRTPELTGSLSLRGGRFDELFLVNHLTEMGENGKPVQLFKPLGNADAYYARFGWAAPMDMGEGFAPNKSSVWSADHDTLTPDQPVTLAWDNGQGVRFLMKVEIDDRFMFTVTQSVINSTDETVSVAPNAFIRRHGNPSSDGLYILHEGAYGVFNGTFQQDDYTWSEMRDGENIAEASLGGWMGLTDKYWMATLVPDQATQLFQAKIGFTGTAAAPQYQAAYVQNWQSIPAGASLETTNHMYAGAKIVEAIDDYEIKYGIEMFDRTIDWGWFYWLTRPIFKGLHYLFEVTGNYGVAILLMTVILKLILFPLANKSYVSMSHMKDAQPKIKKIQERYKDDRQKMQQEMMALYQKEKINPMAGCLPILVQIPIFFALYKTLYVTIEMRHQPFFGWITDLSVADPLTPVNLFGLVPWDPPQFLAIGILPILMGVTMWLQQKLNPQTAMDPTQQKIMSFLPFIFTFIMANFSAGLVLYWTWNNLLSIAQQWVIMRREHARRAAKA